ncbi:hypothetical protein IW261DRAFT_1519872, partial [Armillaria novae-zelandiae]
TRYLPMIRDYLAHGPSDIKNYGISFEVTGTPQASSVDVLTPSIKDGRANQLRGLDSPGRSIQQQRREPETAISEMPIRSVEMEGTTGSALSSSTSMGRQMVYCCIYCWFSGRVMGHEAPEYAPPLRSLPIIVPELPKEGQQEPPIISMNNGSKGRCILWGLAGGILLVVEEGKDAAVCVKWVDKR